MSPYEQIQVITPRDEIVHLVLCMPLRDSVWEDSTPLSVGVNTGCLIKVILNVLKWALHLINNDMRF